HAKGNQFTKRSKALTQIVIFGPRGVWIGTGFRSRLDEIKRGWIINAWQRLKDYGLYPRKDGRIDANAGAERHNHNGSQHGHPDDCPARVTDVMNRVI